MTTIDDSANVLVVDDNSLNLDLLCRILSKANFKTISAIDGKDAINQVSLQHPDLILLDIMMPNLDGFEVCKLIKNNPDTKNIPIIFMTGLADTETKVKAIKLEASDYITKPFQ
ncbi:MAG: response regulator [Pleurocapsa sp.]